MRVFYKEYNYDLDDDFINFVEEKLPALWQEQFGENLFDQGIYGTIQFHEKSIVNNESLFKINAQLVLDRYQNYVVRLTYLKKSPNQEESLSIVKLYSPHREEYVESLVGHLAREWVMHDLFTFQAVELMASTLAEQFSIATSIQLADSPFHYNPYSIEPTVSQDRVSYIEGDLIGPDNHGIWVTIVWQTKDKATPPFDPNDLELLPNERFFSWNKVIHDAYFRENYVDHQGKTTWEIEGISAELSWYKWYNLPDLILQFWTKSRLSESELEQAEVTFWDQLLENIKSTSESYKTLCFDEEVAEQGYAKYFGGFTEASPGHYSMHAELAVCENDVVECWIRALDSLSDKFGIFKIRVGSN